MNILYFHQHFSTPEGATGTRSYEFSKKLISRGHSVTIVCGSYWIASTGLNNQFKNGVREGFVKGIKVIEFEIKYSNSDGFIYRVFSFLRYSFKGLKIALSDQYDVVFATSTPLTAGIPGIFAKLLKKKKFIFEVRDLWPDLPRAMGVIKNPLILFLMSLLESLSYKNADACIGLSPGIITGIKDKDPQKKIIMIPNGCDLNLLDYKRKVKKKHKFIAVFTGAHGLANGLNIVIDAAKILMQRNHADIEIHFIGDGFLKKAMIKRVKNENIYNCKFFDPMPKVKLFTYIKENASVGLMTLKNIPEFYYGTSPNKFFDYISLGLPVLNNYPGWIAELIQQNNCGIVVEPDDPYSIAESLINLKTKPKSLVLMGISGKKLAKERFDRNKLSNTFVDFVESI